MTDHDRNGERGGSGVWVCAAIRELFPGYAAKAALGHPPEDYPRVTAHLAICPACRADLAELIELVGPAYTGAIEPAARYPRADLSFLRQPAAHARPWSIDALGRLLIEFSEALLDILRGPQLAGDLRGQLLYRYVQDPDSVHDLNVTIEAFAEDLAGGLGRVRVLVDRPSRDPLDQSGSRVELRADGEAWQDETDDSGCVDFSPIPLAALPRLRVAISPKTES